VPGFGFSDI